jgi:O-antigen ligase
MLYSLIELCYFAASALSGHLVPGHVAAAFSLNPNYVALYLEPLIGLASGFALFGTGRGRTVAIVALALLLPAEIATFSRGGLVVLALLVVIVVVTSRNRWLQWLALAAGVAGAVVLWNLPTLGDRIRAALTLNQGTAYNRLRIWSATFRMLGDHPLFGAGLNSYQQVMAPYRAGDPYSVPEPYPHNILLTSWTELGLLGLVAFVWILVGLIVRPWRAFAQATGIHRAVIWGTGTAFAMIVVHGLVDSPYWKNDLSVEFWLLAALQVVAIRGTRSPAAAP